MKTCRIVALAALAGVGIALGSCSDAPSTTNGAKGEAGEAGPAGPPGPTGPAGRVIRFVDGGCSQACVVACEDNERIIDTIAINPGGTFTFDADNKATFRPEQQNRPVKSFSHVLGSDLRIERHTMTREAAMAAFAKRWRRA